MPGTISHSTYSPLATPSATREVLERHGIALKKSLGQNFLVNDAIIGKIVELSGIGPEDVVLEVGPGIGTLTYALLERARAVVAIERDRTLPPVLADTLAEFGDRFTLVEKDALDVTAADVAVAIVARDDAHADVVAAGAVAGAEGLEPTKFVANLPYAVAATVVLDYLQSMPSIQSATVMVQREVADRMMAAPGSKNYGAYTVKLSLYARTAGSFAVAPSNFMPPPHVDSTVIRLDRVDAAKLLADAGVECGEGGENRTPSRSADAGVEGDSADVGRVVEAACTMADAAFFARRKTIANSCRQYFSGRDKSVVERLPDIFDKAGVDPKVRGEVLSTADYLRLGAALLVGQKGQSFLSQVEVRQATPEDADAAWRAIQEGRAALKALGIDQWQGTSPSREMVDRDISEGRGFVATVDGLVAGYMMLNQDGEAIYDDITAPGWLTASSSAEPRYLAVHRVATSEAARGTGVGRFMLQEARRIASERGLESVRIDTHEGNVVMRGLLGSLGFTECGVIMLEPNGLEFTRERIAYELLT